MIIVEPNAPVVLNPGPTIFTLSHRYTYIYIWGLPRSHFHRLYGRGPGGFRLLRVCRLRVRLVIHQQLLGRFRSRPARSCKCVTAEGFEPSQISLVELESTPLDHSGKLSSGRRGCGWTLASLLQTVKPQSAKLRRVRIELTTLGL